MKLARGTVVIAVLDPTAGHEQAGRRPCVVVGEPAAAALLRFHLIAVVPLTTTSLPSRFYPTVRPVAGSGLRAPSTALPDNVRGLDPTRIARVGGLIDPRDLTAIDAALRTFLGLR